MAAPSWTEINAIRYTIDPVAFAEEQLKFSLDPWQKDVLRSRTRKKVFNCARQSGKSTIAAIKALHRALFYPNSLIVLISPSERQSKELFRKVRDYIAMLETQPALVEDNVFSLEMANGSRIVALPANEKTIRGYSAVDLVIEDESAAVSDEIHKAVRPMLATSNGEHDQLSTPRGKKGHFWEAWNNPEWERVQYTAADNPRITAEFLEGERRELGSRIYAQEYECVFIEDQDGEKFKREWWKFSEDYPRNARFVRFWDRAATDVKKTKGGKDKNDPDWTAGCLMCEKGGQYWIIDMRHARLTSLGNKQLIRSTAERDGLGVYVRQEQEPGSSGKDTVDDYSRTVLRGYAYKGVPSTGSKVLRAEPFAAAVEAGNVHIVTGPPRPEGVPPPWDYQSFIDECAAFPNPDVHDDQVDSAAGAFNELRKGGLEEFDPADASFGPRTIPSVQGGRSYDDDENRIPGL